MKLYKREYPNGTVSENYFVRVMINGKLINKKTPYAKLSKARAWVEENILSIRHYKTAKALVEDFRNILTDGATIELENALKLANNKPSRRRAGEKMKKQKESVWRDFVNYLGALYPGATSLNDVTKVMAENYIGHIRESGRFDKTIVFKRARGRKEFSYKSGTSGLSVKTIRDYQTILHWVFEKLFDDAGLASNPFARMEKEIDRDKQSRIPFTPEQLKVVKEKADPFVYAIFCVGCNTGFRKGDICMLKVNDINLDENYITRTVLKTRKTIRFMILPGLKRFLETLPLDDEFVLPEHARMYKKNPDGITYRFNQFLTKKGLFEKGKKIETTREVEGRSRRVSILDIHSLRHTFIYTAAIHGVDFAVVKDWVGHISPDMTKLYFDHVTMDVQAKQFENVPIIF